MDAKQRQQYFRRKCIKYVILSMLLTAVMLSTTGCGLFLFGDERVAYNLMVKASEYFKYPSTVRIESGTVSDDTMFCVISGENSYGSRRSDTYFVDDDGYPYDYYSRYCYSDDLNCDLINAALTMRLGGLGSTLSLNSSGGDNTMAVVYIIVLIVGICLNGLLASNASDIAQQKGYDKRKWFHMCFWLSMFSYIIVAAMPDLKMRQLQTETNSLLKQMLDGQGSSGASAQAREEDVSSFLPKL